MQYCNVNPKQNMLLYSCKLSQSSHITWGLTELLPDIGQFTASIGTFNVCPENALCKKYSLFCLFVIGASFIQNRTDYATVFHK